MKNEVINTLLNQEINKQEKFNKLFSLMRKHPHHNRMLVRSFNQAGFSLRGLQTLEYDVKQLYRIEAKDLRKVRTELKIVKEPEVPQIVLLINQVNNLDLEKANYAKDIKPLANEIAGVLGDELANQKKETLVAYLEKIKTGEGLISDEKLQEMKEAWTPKDELKEDELEEDKLKEDDQKDEDKKEDKPAEKKS